MLCKLAVFDLDGTILDTVEDLAASVNAALRASGFPERSLDEVRRFVGNGIRRTLELAAPEGTSVRAVDRLHADFTAHYRDHSADRTRPYGGIPELLAALREAGMRTAVVSNKADFAVKALCERFFPGLFDLALGERDGVPRKPSPEGVLEVLETLGVAPEESVYIGDSEVDIQTARNAGLDEVLVAWGFKGRAFLEAQGAKRVADRPEEIALLLLGPTGGNFA